ncbi:unnamed protein product [Cuscuta campestris]|uniref:AN1-type domain-containing protein n=1 Tax=Cuscuta campestris TaxID=132261 RepID=A0A484N761_9ASTE|nr:unnamed protein product [Cuscuta campestris]
MGGGTEAFPDLGSHCQNSDCRRLDFLPFRCDACHCVFCLEHRSYKSHACPKSGRTDRKVVVCPTCSASIETTGCDGEAEKAALQQHESSGHCDPEKKKKPTCPVRRCRAVLTFSNNSFCNACQLRVCLQHRFPADHGCKAGPTRGGSRPRGVDEEKLLVALFVARHGKGCGEDSQDAPESSQPKRTPSSVKAC